MKRLLCLLLCLTCLVGVMGLAAPTAYGAPLIDDTFRPFYICPIEGRLPAEHTVTPVSLFDFDVATYIGGNWISGFVQGMYLSVLNAMMNAIFHMSVTIGVLTAYVVGEAFRLDFVSGATEQIALSVERLVGVGGGGIGRAGFLPQILLFAVFALGCFLLYTAVLKRETTRALGTAARFVVIFLAIVGLTANASVVLRNLNDFSAELSEAALDAGVSFVTPLAPPTEGQGSVRAVQEMIFDMQIRQPWLLLHFGTTDIDTIPDGAERINALLASNGDYRERNQVLRREIDTYGNTLVTNVTGRLGTVILLFIMNLVLSYYMVLLALLMVLSQLLFVVYFILFFLALIFSLIPGFESVARRGMEKFIRALLFRLGYALILVLAFSLSMLVYTVTAGRAFLFVALLQILVFAGLYRAQDEMLGMFCMSGSAENHRFARGVGRPLHRAGRIGLRSVKKIAFGYFWGRRGGNRRTEPRIKRSDAGRPSPLGGAGGGVGKVKATHGVIGGTAAKSGPKQGKRGVLSAVPTVDTRHPAQKNQTARPVRGSTAHHVANPTTERPPMSQRQRQPVSTGPELNPHPTWAERRAERKAAATLDVPRQPGIYREPMPRRGKRDAEKGNSET